MHRDIQKEANFNGAEASALYFGRLALLQDDADRVVEFTLMRAFVPAIVIAFVVFLLYFFVPGVKEQPWTALRMIGAILAVIGYALVLTARVQLGESFSVQPKATGLITHGLYSRIRNPMYVFVDLMLFGLTLALQMYWLLVILAVLAILQVRQARNEAKLLQEKFGQTYLDYRSQTWI